MTAVLPDLAVSASLQSVSLEGGIVDERSTRACLQRERFLSFLPRAVPRDGAMR
jgi:hypothetical protein